MQTTATLYKLHRYSGIVLGLFLVLHLANQLLLLQGPAVHLQVMDSLRLVYRWPPVEALLLACVLVQIVTGVMRLKRTRGAPNGLATPARIAGMYLLYFLVAHTAATLGGRGLYHLDTNLYFAAAGLHVWPFTLYFVPHYVLALTAIFVHLGSALAPRMGVRKLPARKIAAVVAGAAGALLGAVIVAAMAADNVQIPAQYLAVFYALLPAP
ncbi:hypothetical protein GCM10027277_10160 [Pseudoduganella ginsengisoli]|uniref:Succinate dehydrogenase n=1 Tax=Pseudoduganella ginsengisoli TaxID=1462440 RepID=A0A6L6PXH6_9BURK|nr:hypothetical protein [Pseudoduganella ginsengisoli]MTW01412.1 hypothetical protein [Pseudoduganella ginsengisoli]